MKVTVYKDSEHTIYTGVHTIQEYINSILLKHDKGEAIIIKPAQLNIDTEDYKMTWKRGDNYIECSHCGNILYTDNTPDYCPECGYMT